STRFKRLSCSNSGVMASPLTNGVQLSARGTLILDGSVAPEGAVTAPPGSKYHQTDGSEYRKASGTGNTGWVALLPNSGTTLIHTLLWNTASTLANKYEPNPRPTTGYYRYVGPTDPATLSITLRDGDEWINTAAAATPPPLALYTLPSNVSIATTAPSDITGLSFPVEAGIRYAFDFQIALNAAIATVGYRLAISGPATPTFLSWRSRWSTGVGTQNHTSAAAYDAGTIAHATALVTGNNAVIEGTIIPSVAGTVIARLAVGGTTQTMTALANGSHVEVRRFL
ncbi:MAG TPA: hypothetical protein VNM48_05065, partial [Chloroflexota bacterium]|nr:hypothetical protein [Chloroflexota bacterium]